MKLKPNWREGRTPAEIRLIEQKLIELEKLYEDNPLARFRPYGKQQQFLAATEHVKAFFGGNRCLAAGTSVRMADGSLKPIDAIEAGERVVGVDMHGNCCPVTVLKRWDNGVKPLVSYAFKRGGRFACVHATKEHQFLAEHTHGPYKKRGEQLNKHWRIPRALGFEPEGGDRSLEKWALLWGLLLGDGSFSPNVNGCGRTVTFHNTEVDLLDLAQREAEGLGLGVRRYVDRLVLSCNGTPRGWFYDFLEEHNFNRKAHEKEIPACVFGWSNEAVGRLIAGLWLSDGTVGADKSSIELSTPVMVEQIKDLLELRFGVYCGQVYFRSARKDTHNNQYTLQFGTNAAARRFLENVPLIGRKAEAMKALGEKAQRATDSRYLRFHDAAEVGEGETFDLLVDHPNHMFLLGNGVVVSNSGKTACSIVDDLIQLCDANVLPAHLRKYKRWEAPFYMRIVAPKFNNIEGSVLEAFREWTPRAQLMGDSFDKAYDKQNRKLRFKNGSWVVFNTADQDVDAHSGVKLHRVHFDEEPEGEHGRLIYRESRMRVVDYKPHSQIIFSMTPLLGLSWTYDEIWGRRHEADTFVVVSSTLENPSLDADEVRKEFEYLPEEEKKARIQGEFVSFHGRVLNNFSVEKHVVDPPDAKHVQALDTWVGIDPGIARGGVVWAGFDRDNHMLIYDELYPSGLTVPEIAAAIKEKNRYWGIKPKAYIIDPSARNRSLTNAESVESLFLKEGIPTLHGQNDRRAGVLQLRARIAGGALIVSRDCVNWLKEADRWVVAQDEATQEDSPNVQGDTFKTKGPDHLQDPTRYLAMERLWYQPSSASQKPWHPSMGGAPPASWFSHSVENSGPPTGSMT